MTATWDPAEAARALTSHRRDMNAACASASAIDLGRHLEAAMARICEVESAVVGLHFERDRLRAEVERLTARASEIPGLSATLDATRFERDLAVGDATAGAQALAEMGRMGADLDRLRAEVESMRPVVEAAEYWADSGGRPDDGERATSNLANAIADLRARKP